MPEPVAPTRATVSPGARCRLTSCRTSASASGKRNDTCSEALSSPRTSASSQVPSTMSFSASKISAIRSAAVIASCAIDSRKPSAATGQTSDIIRVMKATSVPSVTCPWPAASAPKPSTMIKVTLGMTPRKVQNCDWTRTRAIEVSCSRAARVRSRRRCGRRPNDLMTRSPCATSSTAEATSPVWSWTARDSRV